MPKAKKTVYVPMVADFLHQGHLNIIKTAAALGEVTVGLFTDENAASYKRLPLIPFAQRKALVESLKGVSRVVEQREKEYEPNLRKYKPDYLVHGTDWLQGPLRAARDKAIAVMAEWGGQVVEPEYTKGISSSDIIKRRLSQGVLPAERCASLKRLLAAKNPLRAMEAHSGLSAMIVETAVHSQEGLAPRFFDALWISSLADSLLRGKPDSGFVDLTARLTTLNDILEVTTKPLIYDGGSVSLAEHLAMAVRRLERLGVSAVVVKDRSSLSLAAQDPIEDFCHKIQKGKAAQISTEFMIIGAIESLTSGAGLDDALARAKAYIQAGADGLMIQGEEFSEFCARYNQLPERKPLFTATPITPNSSLASSGVDALIYGDQLLRSAYSAMQETVLGILKDDCSLEADQGYISSSELVSKISG